jgi:dTDP-4-dehydrorhamnose reductase
MSPLAVLVPGGTGMLGQDIAAAVADGSVVHAPGSSELDIRQAGSVVEAVTTLVESAQKAGLPPVVINAAAYAKVDQAESAESLAFAVNADGPRLLAAVCASRQVPLVHVSTDYVFAGDLDRPYEVDDETGPKSVYGATKLAGELAVLRSGVDAWVVRTQWSYGAYGNNFVKTMVNLERDRETLSVVDDQHGSPTWTADLAAGLLELAGRIVVGEGPAGRVLHYTGSGSTTWCGFAKAIFEELGADPARVQPCNTEDFPRPAPRPKNSVLSGASWAAAGLTPQRPWRDALSKAFAGIGDALGKR